MVYVDQTPAFHTILTSQLRPNPPRPRSPKPPTEAQLAFLQEAYRIHQHLFSLASLLHSIRKPYLSFTQPPPSSRRDDRRHRLHDTLDGDEDRDGDGEGRGGMDKWEKAKYLSEREREEIGLRGKMILRRCRERVGELETGEKARQSLVLPPTSGFYSFLPSLAPSPLDPIQPLVTAHRASILWTLNDLLARTTSTLSALQTERQKRKDERTRSLGSQASREAAHLSLSHPTSSVNLSTPDSLPNSLRGPTADPSAPPIESQLSPLQIQQFESESSTLLNHLNSQIDSVVSAEQSILEISEMQSQLLQHLLTQTEITDRLYDEAVGSVGEVRGANEQLKRAEERGREGRLFLLIFLLGASAGLLFLNWYA